MACSCILPTLSVKGCQHALLPLLAMVVVVRMACINLQAASQVAPLCSWPLAACRLSCTAEGTCNCGSYPLGHSLQPLPGAIRQLVMAG
jgi:hypothetical protein